MATQKLIAAASSLVLLLAPLAWAGPPFITDDPEPVEYQHWEIYLFGIYNHPQGGDTGQLPGVEVNYGIIPEVQLHLLAPLAYDREPGESSHYGIGDTELGVKFRFFQETDALPQAAIFPLAELPTGDSDRGLGNGKAQFFLPVWLQKSFGDDKKWTTYGGGGYWFNPGEDNRNFFRVGWELQRELTEQLTLGGEIFHETSAARGEPGHTAFNLGGFWNFDEHRHLLFSAGRDLDGPNHFSCYLGFQLTF
jgi:hypothetical protein